MWLNENAIGQEVKVLGKIINVKALGEKSIMQMVLMLKIKNVHF